MPVTNAYCNATKYRITLELEVFDDFNPRQIAGDKVLDLGGSEHVESYIEDLSNPVRW